MTRERGRGISLVKRAQVVCFTSRALKWEHKALLLQRVKYNNNKYILLHLYVIFSFLKLIRKVTFYLHKIPASWVSYMLHWDADGETGPPPSQRPSQLTKPLTSPANTSHSLLRTNVKNSEIIYSISQLKNLQYLEMHCRESKSYVSGTVIFYYLVISLLKI